MKMMKKVLAAGLIAAMTLPMCACKKSGKFSMPKSEAFITFLQEKMDAKACDQLYMSEEDWENGFYYSDKDFVIPTSIAVDFGSMKYPTNKIMHSLKHVDLLRSLISTEYSEGPYEIKNEVCYLKFTDDLSKRVENKQTDTSKFACAMLLTFDEDSEAENFFSDYIDLFFGKNAELYEKTLKEYEDNFDLAVMKYQPRYLIPEDAEMVSRKVYDLKDLPEEVYKLDEKKGEGHFCFCTTDEFVGVPDMFRTNDEPEWVVIYQVENDFSLYLDGSSVFLVFESHSYQQSGGDEIYPDEWPSIEFEKDESIKTICKKYGVADPCKFKIDDDLMYQFANGWQFDRGEILHLHEIYTNPHKDKSKKKG